MNKVVKIIICLIIVSICIFCVFYCLNKTKSQDIINIEENNNKENNKQNNDDIVEEEIKEPFVIELEKEKYYIPSRLERYINYNDGTKTVNQIVTEVNCNLDMTFYEDTILADYSKGNLILINKYYYIDNEYKPNNLTTLTQNKYTYWNDSVLSKDAYDAFIKIVDDAKTLGYYLINTSAYRTYADQEYLYNKSLKNNGLEYTLKSSAKPGHSEHHTALATDIVKVGVSMYDFGKTKEFEWLSKNAHKYGFILRYPEGKEYLTGYKYEPWHYRYIGVDAATYIYENNILFEEYYAYFCEYKQEC